MFIATLSQKYPIPRASHPTAFRSLAERMLLLVLTVFTMIVRNEHMNGRVMVWAQPNMVRIGNIETTVKLD